MSSATAEKMVVVHSSLRVQQCVMRGEEDGGDDVDEVRARLHLWLEEEKESVTNDTSARDGASSADEGATMFAAYLEP